MSTWSGLSALVLACAGLASGAAAASELLVGNKSADTLWRLDLVDGRRLGEVATGHGPHEVAVAPDGRTAVVSNYGTGQAPGNTLTVVDLGDGSTRTLSLGGDTRPHGVRWLPDGRRLVVTTEGSNRLLLVDVVRGEVERGISVGEGVSHMVEVAPDGARAWATKLRDGALVRVDLQDGSLREAPAGAGAEGLALASDGTLWVGNRADDTVTVHDADSLAVLATLTSRGFPIRVTMTPDGRHALVTNAQAATLAVFDVATRRQVATVQLAPEGVELRDTMLGRAALPIGAAVAPDGSRAFVAISGADRVAVVDTGSWRVTGWWETGREPDALGIAPP